MFPQTPDIENVRLHSRATNDRAGGKFGCAVWQAAGNGAIADVIGQGTANDRAERSWSEGSPPVTRSACGGCNRCLWSSGWPQEGRCGDGTTGGFGVLDGTVRLHSNVVQYRWVLGNGGLGVEVGGDVDGDVRLGPLRRVGG